MLIFATHLGFVILACLVGITFGQNLYREAPVAPWFGGAMGFAIAVTLIAAEHAFQRRFMRSVVTLLIGLAGGLILSSLLLQVLEIAIQNRDLRHNLDVPLVLVTTYLVVLTALRNADRFRVVVPFIEFRTERTEIARVVLDLSALADARLPALARSGLFGHRLIVHRRLIREAQNLADSIDPDESAFGRRCLAGLADLRMLGDPGLDIDTTELPQATSNSDVLIDLARLEGARVLTSDRSVLSRARTESLSVIDLGELAGVLRRTVGPGDTLKVSIEREGEHHGQGVAFHEDGSMVVIDGGGQRVGEETEVVVRRLHQTAQGQMIFADLKRQQRMTGRSPNDGD